MTGCPQTPNMTSLRLKLILAAVSFFLLWNFLLAPTIYSWFDSTEWIIPPLAFFIVFLFYFGSFSLIFFGLVEGNLEFLGSSLTLGVLTALAMLNIDLGESTIPISPDGSLLVGSLGWKSDLSVLYWYLGNTIGIPSNLIFFFVMFVMPAIVFTLIILSLTTKQVRHYWQELKL